MQKCPHCGFRKTHVQEVRDPKTGKVVAVRTVCSNCQSVLDEKWFT